MNQKDKFGKRFCKEAEKMSEQQFMTNVYLLVKDEFIANTRCNGEKITVELLNGQKFKILVKEA